MHEVIQIVITTSTRDEAERIARHLIEKRLAACVQISAPITSVYRWQGQIEQGEEFHCTIKTVRRMYSQVEAAIGELHSYDVPEILALPVVEASETYLRWVQGEVDQPPRDQ